MNKTNISLTGQALIDGVEFAIDWGLPIPEDDYNEYIALTDSVNIKSKGG